MSRCRRRLTRLISLVVLGLVLSSCGESSESSEVATPARADAAPRTADPSIDDGKDVTADPRGDTDAVSTTAPGPVPDSAAQSGAVVPSVSEETAQDEAEAGGPVDVTAFDTVDFVTPSGLTRCRLTAEGAVCDLPEGFTDSELPELSACYEEGSVPAGVRVDRFAGWRCSEGISIDPTGPGTTEWLSVAGWDPVTLDGVEAAQLPFGSSLTHSGTTCTAQRDAMVCEGPDGATFRMNTTDVTFSAPGAAVLLTPEGLGEARFGDSPEQIEGPLRAVLGEPEESGYAEGCFLGGPTWRSWYAVWGSLIVSGEAASPEDIRVESWSLGMGTTSVPIELPGGLSMESTVPEVLSSDAAAEQVGTYFGEAGTVVRAHGLDFVFDAGGHLVVVNSAPRFCE